MLVCLNVKHPQAPHYVRGCLVVMHAFIPTNSAVLTGVFEALFDLDLAAMKGDLHKHNHVHFDDSESSAECRNSHCIIHPLIVVAGSNESLSYYVHVIIPLGRCVVKRAFLPGSISKKCGATFR